MTTSANTWRLINSWRRLLIAIVAVGAAAATACYSARPTRTDLTRFDGAATGRLEAAMWRSYYEKRPVRLLMKLTESVHLQFHTGIAGAVPLAWRATRAAFAFKDGTSRADYARALPHLRAYFARISAMSHTPFDANHAAERELEWWIIRREPDRHVTAEWETLIADVAAAVYHTPADRLREYARLRVAAMVLRDERGAQITEADWAQIAALLSQAWTSLHAAVAPPPAVARAS